MMFQVDTNMMYHLIKSQSVIKLYIFYNMLEVGDRLFSAFGQDTIDALFWTATEPRDRRREHLGLIPHILFAVAYVCILFKCITSYTVSFTLLRYTDISFVNRNAMLLVTTTFILTHMYSSILLAYMTFVILWSIII